MAEMSLRMAMKGGAPLQGLIDLCKKHTPSQEPETT